jgi:hypothetical protein
MSKAIQGAAMLAGAVGMGIAVFEDPALLASPTFDKIWGSLILGGVAMEAGAIASALTSNRGMEITTRQPASNRQIIYGQQRVGGVMVYNSTTGSSRDQWNAVIVLAGHQCHSIENLYLDGRQVHWSVGSAGNTTRNGVNFGGIADGGTYVGPDGLRYNFGGTGHKGIYCEARYGDQLPGDVIAALTANDPNWAAVGGNSPWLGGCTYVYLKIEFNTSVFPQLPEIKFTVNGKDDIWDPRTSTYGFTQNWALIAGDMIANTEYGIGDPVNQAQLIAAANVCDTQIAVEALSGATESQYTCNYHYDSSVAPGDALNAIMPGACGGVSWIGGEWYIWPDYWQGPSFSFGPQNLTATFQWRPYRSSRELLNRVNGTYTAPTYPFNVAGNLYDKNGWYNGQLQNNFPFAFQTTNYPQYAADILHGYASDEYLNQDGGIERPLELALPSVLSVTQAQRVAKLHLEHNRQQGEGTLEMGLASYVMQPKDVFTFTFPGLGWTDKLLEVTTVNFRVDEDEDTGAQSVRVSYGVRETAETVYNWNPVAEELTVYDVPASPVQSPLVPAAPTNMSLSSSAATATTGIDGTIVPRIEVTWDTPQDIQTTQIQIQYQPVGGSVWFASQSVDVSLNLAYISGVVAGQAYNVQIRSARPNGSVSDWVAVSGYTVSITLPATYSISPLEPGLLIAEAPTATTADILVPPFEAKVGSASVLCLPLGDYYIEGLLQNTLYYVYYVDPTFAGGSITPIATTNTADFVGKVGYYLIDVVRTPQFVAGSGNFYPANFNEMGNSTTLNVGFAYDGNRTTSATVTAKTPLTSGAVGTLGQAQWLGFPNTALSYDTTLYVIAAINSIDNAPCSIVASINGISTTLVSSTTSVASQTYQLAIPRNTNLSAISVTVVANGTGALASTTASPVTVTVSDIYIPYVGDTGTPGSDNSTTNPVVYTGTTGQIIPNGNFQMGLAGWKVSNAVYGTSGGYNGLDVSATGNGFSPTFAVVPGQTYTFTFTGLAGSGTQNVYQRVVFSAGPYASNITNATGPSNYHDFVGGGSLASTLMTYRYTWTCPASVYYASAAVYQLGTAQMLYTSILCQPYAQDTVYVNGVPASSISPIAGLMPIETGADKTKNHVLTTTVSESIGVSLAYGTPIAYTFLQFAVIANDPSDVFSLNAIIEWSAQGSGDYFIVGQPCVLGYLDTPAVIGTSPHYGGSQPSTTAYRTFGFGVGAFSAHSYVVVGGGDAGALGTATFNGSITGLSAGSHTLSLIFIDYSSYGGAELIYANATLIQVSS